MFDPLSASQDVVRDVQDVVRFVIGQMSFEELELVVDLADQSNPAGQEMDGADVTGGESLNAVSQFVVDVGSSHHGFVAFRSRPILDAAEDSLVTFPENPADPLLLLLGVASGRILGDSSTHS